VNAQAAIVVDDLKRSFGAVKAIDGISFDVARGELFGLVGPDGAGKTTLLRMLAGILRPDGGDARLNGTSIVSAAEAAKRSIAYMSQRFGLYADLTVSENLDFYADLYEVPRSERPARLERLFRFSGLEPFRDRLAGRLSGGMKQKLGLSCALIHEPEILLLDEPTFGVDPVSRRELWLIVHEMVARGVTAVVSTAYMDEAERFDRVALLHHGRVVALDTPASLQGAAAGTLIGMEVDRPRAARQALEAHPDVLHVTAFGRVLHIAVRNAAADGPRLTAALREAGIEAGEAATIEPSMEDVFIGHIAVAERA
jgi:ABC-2 type transport system ATP-binding protein